MGRFSRFLRQHGPFRAANCLFCKLFLRLLQRIYKFDVWHATAPLPCREYKVRAARVASDLNAGVLLDLCSGLGEVLVAAKAGRRYGFDIDEKVIRAAKALNGGKARFGVASFLDAQAVASQIEENSVDAAIITGCNHMFDIDTFTRAVRDLQAACGLKRIITETLVPGSLPGSYHHSVEELSRLGEIERSLDALDGVRTLHVIRLD